MTLVVERARREQVLGVLARHDWSTAAEVAEQLGLPEHRTIEVVRTLNELRDDGGVFRSTAVGREDGVVYWAVAS